MLPGCATVLSGTNQTLNITSAPPGASCRITRDGLPIGTIAATPGKLEVGKGAGHVKIACIKPDYIESVVTLPSHYQTSTFWNNAGPGIIGLGVDAASGAMYQYVPDVTVHLVSAEFTSLESRDATFYAMRQIAIQEAKLLKTNAWRGCVADCEAKEKAVVEGLAQRLADLETMKATTRIVPEKN
ncbi:hypothetical protein BWI17_17245 [Betaproteobacteria bacterium GR16-43]|nr:hypothetical protein BWI17_17245 [Betaproteobacteria bacterium GR16-43]